MVVAVWSVKGGVGVSSIAALLAIGQVERANNTLLVDLCGDLPALLGQDDEVERPGIVDWCAMAERDPQALARLEVTVREDLSFVPRGAGPLGFDARPLVETLTTSGRLTIVDCGLLGSTTEFANDVVANTTTSLLVVRECYLNLRTLRDTARVPTGVVVIKEPGRALGRADIEAVAGAPVIAEVAFDSSIARSLDSGVLRSRLPRPLVRAMGRVLQDAA